MWTSLKRAKSGARDRIFKKADNDLKTINKKGGGEWNIVREREGQREKNLPVILSIGKIHKGNAIKV